MSAVVTFSVGRIKIWTNYARGPEVLSALVLTSLSLSAKFSFFSLLIFILLSVVYVSQLSYCRLTTSDYVLILNSIIYNYSWFSHRGLDTQLK